MRTNLRHSVPFEEFGEGAEVLFVGEAPGKEEVRLGAPFVGPSGQLLKNIIESIGLKDYVIANTVQCPPFEEGDKIRTPRENEIFQCGWHIRDLLRERKFRKIILLGSVAAKNFGFSGDMKSLVASNPRGLQDFPETEFWILYHPAYILRQTRGQTSHPLFKEYQEALIRALEAEVEIPQEKLNYQIYSWERWEEAFALFRGKDFALDFETVGSEVRESRMILGVGLGNDEVQIYLDLSKAPDSRLRQIFSALSQLVDENRAMGKKVLVYNQTFESGVFLQVLKDRIRFFDDVWTMAKSLGHQGSLKDLAQRLLGAPSWEEATREIVDWAKKLSRFARERPGVVREYLISGETKYKQLEKLWSERPSYITEDQVLSYLTLLESGEEMAGWSMIPLDVLALYNARDTYWTYRLWLHFRDQLPPIYEEIYQEQENLSTVMQLAKFKISSKAYQELKSKFYRVYLRSLVHFIKHPKAWSLIIESNLKEKPLRKVSVLTSWIKPLKLTRPDLYRLTTESWKKLEEIGTPEAEELLKLLKEEEPRWKEELEKEFRDFLDRFELLQDASWEVLQEYASELEGWYNPSSPKSGLAVFNAVLDIPPIQWALFYRSLTKVLGDVETSRAIETLGPFPEWPKDPDRVLQYFSRDRYRSKLQEAMKALEDLTSSFDAEYFNEIYAALGQFYLYDADDPSTYPEDPEFLQTIEAYLHLRIAKKALKVIATYLDGRTGMKGAIPAKTVEIQGIPIPIGQDSGNEYWAQTDFIAIGADTRRWRSPFHTIPSGTEVRELYTSRWGEDGIFLHYDYAQMEVRVLAALAQEDTLIKKLLDPKVDVHTSTASFIFGIPPEEIQDYQRRYAKTATFAILYGKSLHSFAMEYTSGSLEQAQKVFDLYFQAFPKIKDWIEQMHRLADLQGKVPTLFHPQDLIDIQPMESGYYRRAQNYPVQSSASSLAGVAGMRIFREAQKRGLRLIPLAFTHDAMDFELHLEDLIPALQLIQSIAVDWIREKYGVPVQIDFSLGCDASVGVELAMEDSVWTLSGPKRYTDPLLERLSRFYRFEILKDEVKYKKIDYETILVGRGSMSQFIGQEIPYREVQIQIQEVGLGKTSPSLSESDKDLDRLSVEVPS